MNRINSCLGLWRQFCKYVISMLHYTYIAPVRSSPIVVSIVKKATRIYRCSFEELHSQVLIASWVLFETFPLRAHVSFFHISHYSRAIILISFSSCFTLTVPMRNVYCLIHTSCMGSPFPVVHDRWSLVFSFLNNSY